MSGGRSDAIDGGGREERDVGDRMRDGRFIYSWCVCSCFVPLDRRVVVRVEEEERQSQPATDHPFLSPIAINLTDPPSDSLTGLPMRNG